MYLAAVSLKIPNWFPEQLTCILESINSNITRCISNVTVATIFHVTLVSSAKYITR